MAFVSNSPDLEEEKQSNPSQGAVAPVGGNAGAVHLSPSGGVGAPTGGTAAGPSTGGVSTAPSSTTGGQFGSLNQYLTANQGQAQPLANKLTTGINNQYNNLNNQGTTAINQANQQVQAGAAPSQNQTNAIIAQESANPASFTNTPSNVTSFQGLLNAAYSGPASAESTTGYQNQQNAVNSAIAAGQNAVSTEAGRENLLSQNEATPTTGVTALNSAILSQDPNALNSVEQAYAPFSGLLNNLQTGAAATDQQIAQQQQQAQQTQQEAQQAITNQINALNTNVGNELTTAQQNAATQNAQVQADLAAGTPTASDLAALGITPGQWSTLSAADKAAATSQLVKSSNGQFGANTGTATINPTEFLTQENPNQVINAANVATPQDYANAQAFQSLLQSMNFQAPTMAISPSAAAQAGTAPSNLNQFNYNTALNTAQSTAQDEVAAAQAYVNALQSGADEQHAQQLAQQTLAGKQESLGAAALNTAALPLTAVEQIPTIGAPVARAVNTVTNAVKNATWICTAMRKAGAMTQEEIQILHDHLYKALWLKPWSFLKYLVLGKFLVLAANHIEVDWKSWKSEFYENVMREEDPVKAVELYEGAFWCLAKFVWKCIKD